MAMGSGIDKAWSDATDEVKIASGTSNTRALHWEGKPIWNQEDSLGDPV